MRAPAQYSGLMYLLLILLKTKTRLQLAQMKLPVLVPYLTGYELQGTSVEMIINEMAHVNKDKVAAYLEMDHFSSIAQQPLVDQCLLIIETSRSH